MLMRLGIAVIALGIAYALTQHLFYEPVIMPRLGTWNRVPIYLWLLAFVPEVIVCATVGVYARSSREWMAFALGGAFLIAYL